MKVAHKFTLTNPKAFPGNRAARRAQKAEAKKTKKHLASIQKALGK